MSDAKNTETQKLTVDEYATQLIECLWLWGIDRAKAARIVKAMETKIVVTPWPELPDADAPKSDPGVLM